LDEYFSLVRRWAAVAPRAWFKDIKYQHFLSHNGILGGHASKVSTFWGNKKEQNNLEN
jgi:hypothetical protein